MSVIINTVMLSLETKFLLIITRNKQLIGRIIELHDHDRQTQQTLRQVLLLQSPSNRFEGCSSLDVHAYRSRPSTLGVKIRLYTAGNSSCIRQCLTDLLRNESNSRSAMSRSVLLSTCLTP
jgi:hypothetical protein